MSLIGSYSSFVFVSIAIFPSFLFLYNISLCSLFSCSLSIHLLHILYVCALTYTCKLFQSPYYFAPLSVLLLYILSFIVLILLLLLVHIQLLLLLLSMPVLQLCFLLMLLYLQMSLLMFVSLLTYTSLLLLYLLLYSS